MVYERFGLATDQSEHWQGNRPDMLQMVRIIIDSVAACIATDCATACMSSASAGNIRSTSVNFDLTPKHACHAGQQHRSNDAAQAIMRNSN